MTIFYSDMEPLSQYSPVKLHSFTHYYIPANLFTFIDMTFFILRVPRFFIGVRLYPKMFENVLKTFEDVTKSSV